MARKIDFTDKASFSSLDEPARGRPQFLPQNKGVVEGKPSYDPEYWSKNAKPYADLKLKQVEDAVKKDQVFYPEILMLLSRTYEAGDRILDVGCCGGHYWPLVKTEVGDADYTGIDVTPEYIEVARKTYPEKKWIVGDCRDLPFPDKSFDHVLCLFLLLHLDQEGMRKTVDELIRVARKQVLFAGYFSFVRLSGEQSGAIYDIVNLQELQRPGWSVQVVEEDPMDTPDRLTRIKVRVDMKQEEGTWEELTGEFPIISFVRMVRE